MEGTIVMEANFEAIQRVLDSKDTTTGGGTASSIAGAMAAGLAGMVARLSIGKPGAASEKHYHKLISSADNLKNLLFDGGSKDTSAFEEVQLAYRLPKSLEEEKLIRQQTIESAMTKATIVPLENAFNCAKVQDLCRQIEYNYNKNTTSDLNSAIYLSQAGLLGCVENVKINLPYLRNKKIVDDITKQLDSIMSKTLVSIGN
jgi:formiminotetrahydrofolate cyclodeaminase